MRTGWQLIELRASYLKRHYKRIAECLRPANVAVLIQIAILMVLYLLTA